MARSVRVTWRDPDGREHLADKRRRIKAAIAHERLSLPDPGALATPHGVKIETREQGPLVHYPASEADLRAVLARLPPDIHQGIGSITLGLYHPDPSSGTDDEEDHIAEDEPTDPAGHGLRASALLPGVFQGRELGCYKPRGAHLEIYGYVYDPAVAHRPVLEMFLRLQMLATFVHELGHHDDASRRTARGRWRFNDDRSSPEIYAEAMEYLWVRDVVVPYLHEAYPHEMQALSAWLEQHAGVAFPLELFVDDCRSTNTTDHGWHWLFPISTVWQDLYRNVTEGESQDECRLHFALHLSTAQHHEEALVVLDRLERDRPSLRRARLQRATVYLSLRRFEEAEAIARELIDDPGDLSEDDLEEAWFQLASSASTQGQWERANELAQRLEKVSAGNNWNVRRALRIQAWSLVELRRLDEADRVIGRLDPEPIGEARRMRARWWLLQGRYQEALALVEEKDDRSTMGRAIHFEACKRLGLPSLGFPERNLTHLESAGYHAWAAVLRDLSLT